MLVLKPVFRLLAIAAGSRYLLGAAGEQLGGHTTRRHGRRPGFGLAAAGGVGLGGRAIRPRPGTPVAGGRVLGAGGPHPGPAGPLRAVQRPVLLGPAGGCGGEMERANDPVCWDMQL